MTEVDRLHLDMMAYLDGEMPEEARHAFRARCHADPELAVELAKYERLQRITDSMKLREAEDFEYERFFARLAARLERRIGITLLAAGAVGLLVLLLVELFRSGIPAPFKLLLGLALLGLALLVSSTMRLWLRLRRLDRYQGIRR